MGFPLHPGEQRTTPESIAELRAAVEAYNATGQPGILANWCNRVDFIVAWRSHPADGRGAYIHLTPKTENPAHGRDDQP